MATPKRKADAKQRDPEADRLWIEETAMLFETIGQAPRSAGRILGLLLIADKPSLSQAELAEQLGISLASVSPALRHLIQTGMAEKVRVPGERSDRYQLRSGMWVSLFHSAALGVESYVRQLSRGFDLPGPDISASHVHLRELTRMFRVLGEVLHETVSRLQG